MDLLSGLGDVAVVAPASAALIAGLLMVGARRQAAAFVAAIAVCVALALLGKLAFAVCGRVPSRFDIESPSGHAALGASFWGCLAVALGGGRPLAARVALYAAAAAAALAVAYGRVELGAHTVAEAICGLMIGAVATAVFATLRGPPRRLPFTPQMALLASPVAVLLAVDLTLFTDRWTAEPLIDRIAVALGVALRFCS